MSVKVKDIEEEICTYTRLEVEDVRDVRVVVLAEQHVWTEAGVVCERTGEVDVECFGLPVCEGGVELDDEGLQEDSVRIHYET